MSIEERIVLFIIVILSLRLILGLTPIRMALVARAARHIHQKQSELFNRGYAHGAAMLISGRPVEEIEAQYSHQFDSGPFERGMQAAHKDFDLLVRMAGRKGSGDSEHAKD